MKETQDCARPSALHEIDPRRPDSYRWLARGYDLIARLVFGDAISRAQRALIEAHALELASSERVLWVGGGTGRLLSELLKRAPHAEVTYVEPSASMMRRAISSLTEPERARVRWIHQDHRWLFSAQRDSPRGFDAMITAFFLDVLPESECRILAEWAHSHIKVWLFADFIPLPRRWARALIRFMYICFAFTTRIQQRRLLDLPALLRSEGWEPYLCRAEADTRAIPQAHDTRRFARGIISIERLSSKKSRP